jgi:thiamine pyrophosphate-dependent acetolactate synthase large subunit-like protein
MAAAIEAPPAQAMTGGEAVVRALRAGGAELVFGIPGTHTLPIHRHLTANGIRHVTPRHEQGGGYAADGYARVSGRAGVVVATSGPGVINAATPAATAYADSVPMLVVSPAMPTGVEGRDTGYLHEGKDQRGAMEALVSWSHRAGSPGDAAAAIAAAFEHFAAGRPRPVHVEVPVDVLGAREEIRVRAPRPAPAPLDEQALERAASLLAGAERPAIVLGGGARGAAEAATRLAERLGAPVVTTVNGKGVVSERHPLSLGAQLRLPATQRFLAARDVVLAVGTELGESDLWGPPLRLDGRLIRVDVDAAQLHKNARADVALAGDARAALEGLLDALPARAGAHEDLASVRAAIRAEALADGEPFLPLAAALDEALGRDGILSGDSTMASYYGAVHFVPMDASRRWIYPTGYATLGYALPAAIGAKLAAPARPVIALVGDGGLLFTVAELATAAELGIPLPVLVPNNGGYGEIRAQMAAEEIEPIGVDLRVPDLPALGRAFGGEGLRVDDPARLAPALREALERPGPTIIEVPAP